MTIRCRPGKFNVSKLVEPFPLTLPSPLGRGNPVGCFWRKGQVVGAGDAAGERADWDFGVVLKSLDGVGIAAKFLEAGAELDRHAEKKFGAHVIKAVDVEGTFDAAEDGGKFLEFFFKGGDKFLLNVLDLNGLEGIDEAAGFGFTFPVEKGGFGNAES